MFVIEFEGFNEGVPYEQERFQGDEESAIKRLEKFQTENPRVRWRLIEIKKDFH